jgi:Leucine-rich repeat (LRR) protein
MKKATLTIVLAFAIKALASATTYNATELSVLNDIDQVCDIRNNLNWGEATDPSVFTGITWNSEGCVVEIDIKASGIFGKVDFSMFPNLRYLNCSQNGIESLTVEGLTNLEELRCNNNVIPALSIKGLASLVYVDCSHNIITSLEIEPSRTITYFDFTYNNCTKVNVTGGGRDNSTIEPERVQILYAGAMVSAYPQNEATAIGNGTIDGSGTGADYYTMTGVFVGHFEHAQQPTAKGMYVKKHCSTIKSETVLIH